MHVSEVYGFTERSCNVAPVVVPGQDKKIEISSRTLSSHHCKNRRSSYNEICLQDADVTNVCENVARDEDKATSPQWAQSADHCR